MRLAPFKPNYSSLIFHEDFVSAKSVSDNGGVIDSAVVNNGRMICTAGGAKYTKGTDIDQIFRNGGSARVRFKQATGATGNRVFTYTKDGDFNFGIVSIATSGFIYCQVRNGAGNNYYTMISTTAPYLDQDADVVITWNVSTTTITLYVNGVRINSDNTPGAQVFSPEAAGPIILGDSTIQPYNGEIIDAQVYSKVLTDKEVQDLYNNDTYSKIDASLSLVWLPLRSHYNNGSIEVTKNIGSLGGTATWGDGSTTSTYPSQINPNGMNINADDKYIKKTIPNALGKDFTIGISIAPSDLSATSHVLMEIGDYTTDGIIAIQFGAIFVFLWNEAVSPDIAIADILSSKVQTIILSSIAGIVSVYIDGELKNTTDLSAKTGLSASLDFVVSQETANSFRGDMYNPFVFDFGITELQAKALHHKLLSEVNI